MTTVATQPRRRTQAERRNRTRGLLLDAALDCLVEHGYAGTTTLVVAARAGVSRGAQLHHYPTRAALVASAIEHLFARLTEEFREAFARLESTDRRLVAAVDLLWTMFEKPRFAAVLELYMAARSDRELHACLLPIAMRHRENVRRVAAEYFPEIAADGGAFEQMLTLVLDAMHGMAIARFVYGDEAGPEIALTALRGLAERFVAPLATGGAGT